MLFKCFDCDTLGFERRCRRCGDSSGERPAPRQRRPYRIPIDPALLPDFQYQATGFLEKVVPPIRRNSREEWQQTVDSILETYEELREPYFLNFLLLLQNRPGALAGGTERSGLDLLEALLQRLGFDELGSFNDLTRKLILSTDLQQEYLRFSESHDHHMGDKLADTLRSWIDERGTAFRSQLPLMVYHLWDQDRHTAEVDFGPESPPLVSRREMKRLYGLCNDLYFQILVDRLQVTLEQFDPTEFMTIYDIDAMPGTAFESFLEELFRARGYEIEGTPTTGDQGADLLAERFGQTVAIQAKNYQGTVGNSAVQQAISARSFYSAEKAMVVTNSRFSSSARELASSSEVRLVDRDRLQDLLDDYNQHLMTDTSGGVPEER